MAKWINLLEVVYPIGSIYQSTKNLSPASIVGGTWEQITEKFLFAAGSTYMAGETGGEATHALSIAEMPAHTHGVWQCIINSGQTIKLAEMAVVIGHKNHFRQAQLAAANRTIICHPIMSFIFGREFLSTQGGAK